MKICFILEYYWPHIGGGETLFKNLIEGLVKEGHRCIVITSHLPQTSYYEVTNGVEVYRIKVPTWGERYWFTFLSFKLALQLSRKCDLLHTMTYNGMFSTACLAKLWRKPAVVTVLEVLNDLWKTSSGMNWLNTWLHILGERLFFKLPFNKYLCISQYTKKCLEKIGINRNKICVIYPGVDEIFLKQNNGEGKKELIKESLGLKNKYIYMYFGRPGVFKGIEYLLAAVPLVSREIPEAKLLLILADSPKDRFTKIKELIVKLNIQQDIILLPPQPIVDLIKYIYACETVVVPSLSEGFGLTCVEACSIGKPVVATNVGSIPEVISGKYLLIPPHDPQAIAEGIKKIYQGNYNKTPLKIFNWEKSIKQHLRVYEDLRVV